MFRCEKVAKRVHNRIMDRGPPNTYMKAYMKDVDESWPPEVETRKLQILSAKFLTGIGTWNVRSLYIAGRVAQTE